MNNIDVDVAGDSETRVPVKAVVRVGIGYVQDLPRRGHMTSYPLVHGEPVGDRKQQVSWTGVHTLITGVLLIVNYKPKINTDVLSIVTYRPKISTGVL